MRQVAFFILVVVFILSVSSFAMADAKGETIEVKISELYDNFAMKTSWGNVYFNIDDVHKLTDSAAKLRPVTLGNFTTDTGSTVKVSAITYKAGIATMLIKTY